MRSVCLDGRVQQVYEAIMHLSDYMAKKQLSDDQVALAIGRSRVTVSRIRRRKVRPDWSTINALAAFTDGLVTADDFSLLEVPQ